MEAGAPGGKQWKMAVVSTVAGRGGGGGVRLPEGAS